MWSAIVSGLGLDLLCASFQLALRSGYETRLRSSPDPSYGREISRGRANPHHQLIFSKKVRAICINPCHSIHKHPTFDNTSNLC